MAVTIRVFREIRCKKVREKRKSKAVDLVDYVVQYS